MEAVIIIGVAVAIVAVATVLIVRDARRRRRLSSADREAEDAANKDNMRIW